MPNQHKAINWPNDKSIRPGYHFDYIQMSLKGLSHKMQIKKYFEKGWHIMLVSVI